MRRQQHAGRRTGLAALVAIFALPPLAADAGDAKIGAQRAKQWCADCHLVAVGQKGPVPDTPPTFMALANDPRGAGYLRTFLKAPHADTMRGLQISTYDIDDLVAYVESLRGK